MRDMDFNIKQDSQTFTGTTSFDKMTNVWKFWKPRKEDTITGYNKYLQTNYLSHG